MELFYTPICSLELLKACGYMSNVFQREKEYRTISLSGLPPLVINRHYKRKRPILRLSWIRQSTDKSKIIILEEIKMRKGKELRLRYNIIGKKGKSRYGKWTFGQFVTFVPPNDFRKLIALAKKHKMI